MAAPARVGSFSIRRALLSDAAEIAQLSGQLGYPVGPAEMSSRLSRLLQDADRFVGVAEGADSSSLVGWVAAESSLVLELGEEIEIVGLVVRDSVRRSGLGQALLAEVEEWARGRGHFSIRVRSNVERAESHPFYQRMGYTRIKTQHCYRKQLASPNE